MATNAKWQNRREDEDNHSGQPDRMVYRAEILPGPEENTKLLERIRLIQTRAYELWEEAGRPNSDFSRESFWCEAERELLVSAGSMICGGK